MLCCFWALSIKFFFFFFLSFVFAGLLPKKKKKEKQIIEMSQVKNPEVIKKPQQKQLSGTEIINRDCNGNAG